MVYSAIHWITEITARWTSAIKNNPVIHWIVIYPADSAKPPFEQLGRLYANQALVNDLVVGDLEKDFKILEKLVAIRFQ